MKHLGATGALGYVLKQPKPNLAATPRIAIVGVPLIGGPKQHQHAL